MRPLALFLIFIYVQTFFALSVCGCHKDPPPPKTTAQILIGSWKQQQPPGWEYTFENNNEATWRVQIGGTTVTEHKYFYVVQGDSVKMAKYEPLPVDLVKWRVEWLFGTDSVAAISESGVFKPFIIKRIK